MRVALIEREFGRAVRNGDPVPERFEAFIARLQTWDLGQLSHRVRTQYRLPDDPWLQIFKDAKDLRNNIAHDFWTPYYGLLSTQAGIEVIVRNCAVLERHFQHLARGLVFVTGVDMPGYVAFITSKDWDAETKAALIAKIEDAEEAVANLPDWGA